jgi:isocitrate/isopropylmalate dehydrogenase
MSRNAIEICVRPGDGIGPEVTDAAIVVAEAVQARHGFALANDVVKGGAHHYRDTGVALTEDGFARAAKAQAVLFGAMGWPDILDLRVEDTDQAGKRRLSDRATTEMATCLRALIAAAQN